MAEFKSANQDVIYKHDRVVRVVATFKDGSYSTGSGFFVNENGKIMTCWHVLFGHDLKIFKLSDQFKQDPGNTDAEKIDNYFKNIIGKIGVENSQGNMIEVTLVGYDYYYDLAILQINSEEKWPFFELDSDSPLDYIDEINYCGYPESSGYTNLNSPFAINTGVVSAFPEVDIAGGKYRCVQLNSICIGGNSGAPLFKAGSNKVVGIINGYQWKGSERVPLSISFATGFDLLKEKSEVFKQ